MTANDPDAGTRRQVTAAVLGVLVARTAANASLRVVYPFLPAIARGLGTSFGFVAALVALRSLAGIFAPALPGLAERWGRRTGMLIGLSTAAVGCALIAGVPTPAAAAVGFLAVGLGKVGFDVPMQGWFAAKVPYHRRGRVFGLTEIAWALSLLLVAPAGALIALFGWRSPFVALIGLLVIGAVAVIVSIDNDRPTRRRRAPLRLRRAHVRMLGAAFAFRAGAEIIFVVYGRWLEDDFGLTVTAIGLFTLALVGAELTGSVGVTTLSDRIGLRRMVLGGLIVSSIACATFGLVGGSLGAALVVVIVWIAGFETTVVAAIPMISELAVDARDRLLAALAATFAVGGAVGAVAAPLIYAAGGIAASGLGAAAVTVCAAFLVAGAREVDVSSSPT